MIRTINKILISLVIFFLPVYFDFFFFGASVFELPKTEVFRLLVSAVFFLSMFDLAASGDLWAFWGNLRKEKVVLGAAAFLACFALATVFSIDIRTSVIGLYDRQQGFISQVFYFVFFLICIYNIRTRQDISALFATAASSSFFVCVYGLAQATGWDAFIWTEPFSITGRITSTLGQPNFLASYLLLAMAAASYFVFKGRNVFVKIAGLSLLMMQLAALYYSMSRAGWIGLLAGGGVGLSIFVWSKRKAKRTVITSFVILVLVVVAMSAALPRYMSGTEKGKFLDRAKSIISLESGSNAARVAFWKIGWEKFLDRPIIGYGPESQGLVYSRFYEKRWAEFGLPDDFPNRAHNIILDILLSGGIILFASYAFLVIEVMHSFWKMWRNGEAIGLLVFSGISGYLVSLLFGFETVATAGYFWFFAAVPIVINHDVFQGRAGNRCLMGKMWQGLIFGASLLGVTLSTSLIISPLVADFYLKEMKNAAYSKDAFQLIELFHHADRYVHAQPADKLMVDSFFDWSSGPDGRLLRYAVKNDIVDIIKRADREYVRDYILRGKGYALLAVDDGSYNEQMVESFDKAVGLSPFMPGVRIDFARAYYLLGEMKYAKLQLDEAWKNLPDFMGVVGQEKQRRDVDFYRYQIDMLWGDIYFSEKDYTGSVRAYEAAQGYYGDNYINRKLANIYYEQKDFAKAIKYNQIGADNDPSGYFWPFSIALIYKETGNRLQAEEYAKKALGLSQDNRDIQSLLEELAGK